MHGQALHGAGVGVDELDAAVGSAIARCCEGGRKSTTDALSHARQRDAVLGAARPGEAWLDGTQIQLEQVVEDRIRAGVGTEQALLLRVPLDEIDLLVASTRQAHVAQRFVVDREEGGRGAVFGTHVGDRCAIGQAKLTEPRPGELHKTTDDAALAQDLGDRKHQVGRRRAFGQLTVETKAHDLGSKKVHRLAEQHRLGFDATDPPPQHAQTVDHGGVRVGADQRVGHGDGLSIGGSAVDDCCQVFEIDLVHDAAAGRHDTKVLERFLRPAQQGVAFQVALVLASDVHLERVGAAEVVNLDRVVDDQIARDKWIDALRITPETRHCGPHGGQVDRGGHAREVLQEHTCRVERELALLMVRRMPACQTVDLTSPHDAIASIAQQVLQQHFDGHRQPLDTGVAVFGQTAEAVVRDRAGRGLQRRASSFKRFGGRLPGAHGLSLPQGSAIAYIVAPRLPAARAIRSNMLDSARSV